MLISQGRYKKKIKVVLVILALWTLMWLMYVANRRRNANGRQNIWYMSKLLVKTDLQTSIANTLYKDIYCFIYISTPKHAWIIDGIDQSWGSGCGQLDYFCLTKFHPKCSVPENTLTRETEIIQNVWRSCYSKHMSKFKWFFRIQERAYIVIDNLLLILDNLNYQESVYLGRMRNDGVLYANASYVLSQAALRSLFVSEQSMKNININSSESEVVTQWLKNSGVSFVDTSDKYNRETFHSHDAMQLIGSFIYFDKSLHLYKKGNMCCSNYTVSFLTRTWKTFQETDILLRQIKVFGYQKPSFIHSQTALTGNHQIEEVTRSTVKNVKVLCWILAMEKRMELFESVIYKTWAHRCDKYLVFVTNSTKKRDDIIELNIEEGRDHLVEKVYKAFEYCHNHYIDDYDWFMKADDDTYIVVQNLRYFLSRQDSSEKIFFGYEFKPKFSKHIYMSGGSGYVLSKASLKTLVKEGLSNPKLCPPTGEAEDVVIGACLGNLGIKTRNTMDDFHRETFFPLGLRFRLHNTPPWFFEYSVNRPKKKDFVGQYPISFHYTPHLMMKIYDFLIYSVAPNKRNTLNKHFYSNNKTSSKVIFSDYAKPSI